MGCENIGPTDLAVIKVPAVFLTSALILATVEDIFPFSDERAPFTTLDFVDLRASSADILGSLISLTTSKAFWTSGHRLAIVDNLDILDTEDFLSLVNNSPNFRAGFGLASFSTTG